jgi:hypothetical protein
MVTVESCTEFGYELQLVIPYAYYLKLNNKLDKTISCSYTKELYYFSDNHSEKYSKRHFSRPNVPNKSPHQTDFNYGQWVAPPYKLHFKNNIFVFDKPLLIIHNKYNSEWGHEPINFLDCKILDSIFSNKFGDF